MGDTAVRQPRQRVTRADGSVAVQTKRPRADVLYYPRHRWATVLVRRTHDVELARELAEARWAEIGEDAPLVHHRIGWWATYASSDPVPTDAAEDQHGRVVRWTRDDREHAAGPGVEFRP